MGDVYTHQKKAGALQTLRNEIAALRMRLAGAEARAAEIDEHRHAEAEARRKGERLRLIIEGTHDGIWEWDLVTNQTFWSNRFYELLGLNPAGVELNYERVRELVHPEDREIWQRALREQLKKDTLGMTEVRIRRADGSYGYFLGRGKALCDASGRAVRMVGSLTDITERKQAEAALRDSEERYRDLFENAHDIIYTLDLNGNVTSINKAGERLLGYSRDELLHQPLGQILNPADAERIRVMVAEKVAGRKEVRTFELEFTARDGRRIAVEISSRLIYSGGTPVGIQGIARDITERRLLEAQLLQAQKMEAVGKLAGGVAHDFNNLLTVINGYSDLALRRLSPLDPMRRDLEEIHKAGQRAAALTSHLLAFSRKQILRPCVLDLDDAVRNLENMLRRLIGEDIELVTALNSAGGFVKADPTQIEQVILNLVVNARDAMPRGGKLLIETARRIDPFAGRDAFYGPALMLAVSDTGCGMSADVQAHIFEPFFTTKEQGKGTGLGLSTVYGIVKQSGGDIQVESEVGCGATFRIYLPEVREGAAADEEKERAAARRGRETILLVEDEEAVRNLARVILQMHGYTVLEARHGAEALEIARTDARPIHLIITDVVMPEMGGRELAERVALLRGETRVIYTSGYTDDAIVHHGIIEQEVAFLQKPYTPDALVHLVRDALDARRLRQAQTAEEQV